MTFKYPFHYIKHDTLGSILPKKYVSSTTSRFNFCSTTRASDFFHLLEQHSVDSFSRHHLRLRLLCKLVPGPLQLDLLVEAPEESQDSSTPRNVVSSKDELFSTICTNGILAQSQVRIPVIQLLWILLMIAGSWRRRYVSLVWTGRKLVIAFEGILIVRACRRGWS